MALGQYGIMLGVMLGPWTGLQLPWSPLPGTESGCPCHVGITSALVFLEGQLRCRFGVTVAWPLKVVSEQRRDTSPCPLAH